MSVDAPSILGPVLLAATPLTPLLLLAPCALQRWRKGVLRLAAFAPLPALAASLLVPAGSALVLDESRLGLTLALDPVRSLLLGVVALLWVVAGGYASAYLRDDPHRGRFGVSWLLSLSGCLGVFVAADLGTFYLLFALASLPAFGLVVHDGTPAARRAAFIYLELAIAGEAFLLLGFVHLAAATPGDSLLISEALAHLPTYGRRTQALVFLLLGFGIKAGLVPLHGWLPLAHPAAPMPASAVLSGAVIKSGVIGLVAFLPSGAAGTAAFPGWGETIAAIGFLTAFYTVAVGATQREPKTILAYSSASQMGVATAILGMGLVRGDLAAPMLAAFYAAHHALVKGALFMGVGVLKVGAGRFRSVMLGAMAILGLALAGLPFTGGAVAKLAGKPVLDAGVAASLATVSAIGTAMLMVHFVRQLGREEPVAGTGRVRLGLALPWMACAAAGLVLPWLLARHAGVAAAAALGPGELWSASWPIAIGAILALLLARVRLPAIPPGDLVVLAERGSVSALSRSGAVELFDAWLRRWWVAAAAVLAVALALAALMVVGSHR